MSRLITSAAFTVTVENVVTPSKSPASAIVGQVEVARTGKTYGFEFYPDINDEGSPYVVLFQNARGAKVPAKQLRDVRHAVRQHFEDMARRDAQKVEGDARVEAQRMSRLDEIEALAATDPARAYTQALEAMEQYSTASDAVFQRATAIRDRLHGADERTLSPRERYRAAHRAERVVHRARFRNGTLDPHNPENGAPVCRLVVFGRDEGAEQARVVTDILEADMTAEQFQRHFMGPGRLERTYGAGEYLFTVGSYQEGAAFFPYDNLKKGATISRFGAATAVIEPETQVEFRKFPEGDVIALFVNHPEGAGLISSYQHVGQHGAASVDLLDELEPASPDEYASLKRELESSPFNYRFSETAMVPQPCQPQQGNATSGQASTDPVEHSAPQPGNPAVRSAQSIRDGIPAELLTAYQFQRAHKLAFQPHDKRTRSDARTASAALTFARLSVVTDKERHHNDIHVWAGTGTKRWLENPAECGLRFVGYADKLSRSVRHTGWFTDEFQDSKIRGVVYQLSGKHTAPRYIAGHDNEDNGAADCGGPAYLDFSTVFIGAPGGTWAENNGDAADAARVADRIAELTAEEQRDHNDAWQAGLRYAELTDEYKGERKQLSSILAELRDATGSKYRAALCRIHTLQHFAERRCKLMTKRHKLFSEYGNTDAFREHLSA